MVFGLGGHKAHENGGDERQGRGREAAVGTGRGGAGNMLRSPSRGRTDDSAAAAAKASILKNPAILASGRGGAGNVRSPSRDPTDRAKLREAEARETHLQEDYMREDAKHTHTSGRGGAGNLKREESQERGRGRDSNGSNGGGVGNVGMPAYESELVEGKSEED